MKKIITLLLTFIVCVSLCACGRKVSMSKEEMLSNAQEIDIVQLLKDYGENSVRAEETHVGNTYIVTGYISSIKDDYVTITDNGYFSSSFGCCSIHVYLSNDELILLNEETKITIVGEIDRMDSEPVKDGTYPYWEMKNAYLICNEYEITGRVKNVEKTYCRIIDDNNDFYNVYFETDTVDSSIIQGDTITVSGQCKLESFSTGVENIEHAVLLP